MRPAAGEARRRTATALARRMLFALVLLMLLLTGGLPLLVMVADSISGGDGGRLAAYRALFASTRPWLLMGNSMVLATLTTSGSLVLGIPAGVLVSRTDLPGRRALAALLAMPLLLPPYLTAVAWMGVGTANGLVAGLLFGLPGCVLVLTTAFMPLVMILVATTLRAVPRRLEDAGLMLSGWPAVLRRISLPLIAPGILLAAALVFLLTLGEVSVPLSLRYPVFAVESLNRFAAFYDLTAATAAAMPLAGVTALVLGAEAWLARRTGGAHVLDARAAGDCLRIPLGGLRTPVTVVAWGAALALVGWPFVLLIGRAGGVVNYVAAFRAAGDSLVRSLLLAGTAGALLAGMGFLLALFIRENGPALGAAVGGTALFLFAVPGPVIGVGLIVLWNRPWANLIYATPLMLLAGYLARYTAVTLRLNRAFLDLLPEGLVDAARVAGAGWFQRLVWVVTPLAWRGIAAAWLAGAVFCLRDVGLSLLVHPPGADTLPVRIMTLAANGAPEMIAALCVILVLTTLFGVVCLMLILGREKVLA